MNYTHLLSYTTIGFFYIVYDKDLNVISSQEIHWAIFYNICRGFKYGLSFNCDSVCPIYLQ